MTTTIFQLLNQAKLTLSHFSSSPTLDAEILLAFVLEKERIYLHIHANQPVESEHYHYFWQLIERRKTGYPIAYIIGYREFWGLTFLVNSHVLIPRPETELLVELVLQHYPKDYPVNVVDLGTGSGAIALAIAKERPNWKITAVDISSEALAIAKINAEKLNIANVCFLLSDWFQNMGHQKFDLIIANPPYIAKEDMHLQIGEIKFEPSLALVAKKAGYACIEKIILDSKLYLNPTGKVYLEHGFNQAKKIQAFFEKLGYINILCKEDFSGHSRVTMASLAQ